MVDANYSDAVDVLVVDDDDDIREMFAVVLTDAGYKVAVARDGAQALEFVRSGRPVKLVLSDLHMPVMSGRELLEVMQTDHPNVPMVLVSSSPKSVLPASMPILEKPSKPDRLLEIVAAFTSRQAAAPEAVSTDPLDWLDAQVESYRIYLDSREEVDEYAAA